MAIRNTFLPTCTVVVCTRDRPNQLDQCLAALARLDYPAYETVVVDNAPSDERSREVALRWGVRYTTEPLRGLSRARNRGARACETEIVAYLDDDARAEPGWLSALARDFADPRVMAVTGAILPTRLDEELACLCEKAIKRPAETAERRIIDSKTARWFEIANFGGAGDGSNMAFRRSTFDTWSGFDERLGRGTILNGGEEHYAFFTLIERGYRVVYNPKAIVRHPVPRTIRELRSRHLNVLATGAAYITRLAVEHPSYRKVLVEYLLRRLRAAGQPRTHRAQSVGAHFVPRWLAFLVMLSGPWIYLRSRIAGEAHTKPGKVSGEKFVASANNKRSIA